MKQTMPPESVLRKFTQHMCSGTINCTPWEQHEHPILVAHCFLANERAHVRKQEHIRHDGGEMLLTLILEFTFDEKYYRYKDGCNIAVRIRGFESIVNEESKNLHIGLEVSRLTERNFTALEHVTHALKISYRELRLGELIKYPVIVEV